MTGEFCNSESLDDFVAQLSDVLRFVFDQPKADIVVLVGDDGVNRTLLTQFGEIAPSALARGAKEQTDILCGRTRIRRISERLHVVV